jgi:hypothetical protein
MLSTSTNMCRSYSAGQAFSGFCVVVALAMALMAVRMKGHEEIKTTEVMKAAVPASQDDVSAADALQWRQEFLWHRSIPKVCASSWIGDQACARATGRL